MPKKETIETMMKKTPDGVELLGDGWMHDGGIDYSNAGYKNYYSGAWWKSRAYYDDGDDWLEDCGYVYDAKKGYYLKEGRP